MKYGMLAAMVLAVPVYFIGARSFAWGVVAGLLAALLSAVVTWRVVRR